MPDPGYYQRKHNPLQAHNMPWGLFPSNLPYKPMTFDGWLRIFYYAVYVPSLFIGLIWMAGMAILSRLDPPEWGTVHLWLWIAELSSAFIAMGLMQNYIAIAASQFMRPTEKKRFLDDRDFALGFSFFATVAGLGFIHTLDRASLCFSLWFVASCVYAFANRLVIWDVLSLWFLHETSKRSPLGRHPGIASRRSRRLMYLRYAIFLAIVHVPAAYLDMLSISHSRIPFVPSFLRVYETLIATFPFILGFVGPACLELRLKQAREEAALGVTDVAKEMFGNDYYPIGTVAHDNMPVLLDDPLIDENIAILGQAGSGKTSRGLIPLIEYGIQESDDA